MNKVKERGINKKKGRDNDKASGAKPDGARPDQEQPTTDEHRHDPWPPSGGPGERSDKDAIGRPVQLDKD